MTGAAVPSWFEPMKAVLAGEPFSDPDWIFERKLDGIRCIAIRDGGEVRLLSRNDLSLDERFPEVAEALAADACERFAVDGEVVAFEGAQTSFARLQRRGHRRVAVFLYIFDAVQLDGEDISALPLRERKWMLRSALAFEGPVRYSQHRNERGEEMYEEACRKGLEGVIAKRADSPYRHARSRDWLKLKCSAEQELVVGGFTAPQGSRTEFGALLVGYYDAGTLRYAGKVGTGFDQRDARGDRRAPARAATWTLPRSRTSRSACAARTGSSRSSWRRSASPSGRATGACATRASSACARTSPPREVVRERPS